MPPRKLRSPPVVCRQEVHWVPETRRVPLKEKPYRVWTLYGEGREDPKTPPVLPITPIHLDGSFLEDHIHDWNFENGTLRYYSRAMLHSCWILVEYTEPEKR